MFVCCLCFFFQAEDGIRDLVRSRGLGDVYKRQVSQTWLLEVDTNGVLKRQWFDPNDSTYGAYSLRPVSYTHLTLPTSDLV